MKTWLRAAVLTILLLCPLTAFSSSEGPLQIKNQFPIFLHVNQPYLEKAEMESSMSYSLSHSSTYTVQSSGSWLMNLDMEITELNFRYKRTLNDFIEIGLDIPVIYTGAGFMDGFLESYHDTFGFSDYGRSARPHNDFLYTVRKNGNLIVQGKSGFGLGDIRLALKKPLITSDGLNLSIKADVELPVGDAKKGFGNGSVDAGLSILLDKSISEKIMTYWNFGGIFAGDVRGHQTLDIENFIYGGAAIEAQINEKLSLLAQVMGQTAIYPTTDLLAVDRDAWMMALGGRYHVGKGSLELSLTEDINTSGAPDFIFNLTYKIVI